MTSENCWCLKSWAAYLLKEFKMMWGDLVGAVDQCMM